MPKNAAVGVFTFRLDAPVVLGEAVYVRFPDDLVLPIE